MNTHQAGFFRKRSWLMCLCMPGCIFLTDKGVVKDALFLHHFPFFFLLFSLFLLSTEIFSCCCENVRAHEWSEHIWMEDGCWFLKSKSQHSWGGAQGMCCAISWSGRCLKSMLYFCWRVCSKTTLCCWGVRGEGLSQGILNFVYYFLPINTVLSISKAGDCTPSLDDRCSTTLMLTDILAPRLGSGGFSSLGRPSARARQNHLETVWSSSQPPPWHTNLPITVLCVREVNKEGTEGWQWVSSEAIPSSWGLCEVAGPCLALRTWLACAWAGSEAVTPFCLGPDLLDQNFISAGGEFCSKYEFKSTWTWRLYWAPHW